MVDSCLKDYPLFLVKPIGLIKIGRGRFVFCLFVCLFVFDPIILLSTLGPYIFLAFNALSVTILLCHHLGRCGRLPSTPTDYLQ